MALQKAGFMAAALLMAMADAATGAAQESDQTPAAETSLINASEDAPPKWLGAISVTATRNPIEAFEYPDMVTLVGQDQIQLLQASTPDDILRFVPNVEFTGGPRRTGEVPSIRGFSGPDVIILFDGSRQNFNAGHDGRFFIDPSLIKEVEVLRGPASRSVSCSRSCAGWARRS